MEGAGPLLLLSLCWASGNSARLSHKGIGEACTQHDQCQSHCCATNSLNPQKFCSPQTVFLHCMSWLKPDRHTCSDHSECQSSCCVTNSHRAQMFCAPRTIFLQWVPWRKPNGAYCSDHSECHSRCCIWLTTVSPHRCVPQSRVLVQCLLLTIKAKESAGNVETTENAPVLAEKRPSGSVTGPPTGKDPDTAGPSATPGGRQVAMRAAASHRGPRQPRVLLMEWGPASRDQLHDPATSPFRQETGTLFSGYWPSA